MTSFLKKYWASLLIAILGTAIIMTTWIANGIDSEDGWLYIFCIFLILHSAWITIPKKK
ncbi:MAG: hypothetical protein V4697_01835 [Patescibacteria group bacterium]